ncbi:MAG: TonB-dependent receptor [Vicinamibacteraceae bacterium]|nr:TonB-dependent receptor [Vicinamibacteraceae bacterium]
MYCPTTRGPRATLASLTILVCLLLPWSAAAQSTTATIQGTVSDDTGVLPGVVVIAREQQSGFQYESVTDGEGRYQLAGLRPGTYEITVTMDQYKPAAKTVQVLLGQTPTVDFRITPDIIYTESVQVVGDSRIIETKTSQVTTNVTEEQVRYLPQNTRNFLNFAALAPNVRVSDNETRKEITSGALGSQNTNVFIDGVSYKNDVIDGGVVGQDASRGSPFPQNAVQEFQVLTQNFKAEYEKAASAIITAITKSGGNTFRGDVFGFYQDKDFAQNQVVRNVNGQNQVVDLEPKPAYERWQWGASIGGPIIRDKAQFFVSYEENRQDRANLVEVGTITGAPASLVNDLRSREGTFTSPFRERLLFTKGSLQPRQGHQLELTYSLRHETDIRSFGGRTSFESAENVRNRVDSAQGKYQIAFGSALNETYLSYQRYRWNPTAEDYDTVGQDFEGLLRIGGRDTNQRALQQRTSLRNDYTRFFAWRGTHTAKVGGVLSFADYQFQKEFNGNPIFRYRSVENYAFPYRANYGVGDPNMDANNLQFGIFVQDDWAMTPRFTLNVGLRWDYESDMLNNDYVTPDNVRAAAASFVNADDYFTDGDDRPAFYGAWQPRVGFSYDVLGNGRTVVFGGWGRYYDRVLYNSTLDERFRQQYAVRRFEFSADGVPIRDGVQTIAWNDSYLSRAGLDGLINRGIAPGPEIFLIYNDTKPPVSDQWSLGLRQSWAGITFSATYSGIRSRDLLTFLFATRRPDGTCCLSVPGGFANILISDPDGRKAWFDGFYFQADRPYGVGGARWGFSFTYTLGFAEQTGGDLFSLDAVNAAAYGRYPTSNDERHRVVATGIVGLPWDIVASTFITLGSGTPYTINDQSAGGGVNERRLRRNEGQKEQFTFIIPDAWAYRTMDVRLEKILRFRDRHQVSVALEAFNVFSFDNFSGYDGFIPTLPATNPNFGRPSTGNMIDPGRRLQVGVRYAF